MRLLLVIINFVAAVLGLISGIMRLAMNNADILNIVLGIVWLIIGAVWLWNAILSLKLYNKLKNKTEDEEKTDG